MTERWFRFYDGALNDPKVQRLPPELFKTWVNLLCFASQCREEGVLPVTDDIAFALRMDGAECRKHLDALIKAGLIETDPGSGCDCVHNWTQRQYNKPSDAPEAVAARKRDQRAKEKETEKPVTPPVTPLSRASHATESESESESEKTQKVSAQESTNAPARQKPVKRPLEHHDPDGLRRFYDLYPRKKDPKAVQEAWDNLRPGADLQRKILENVRLGIASQDWHDDAGRAIPYPATYLNNGRWEDTYTSLLPARASPNGNGSRPPAINGAVAQVDTLTAQIDKIRGR